VGVRGNEQADEYGKQAANLTPQLVEPDPNETAAYPVLKSATLQLLKASTKAAWKAVWKETPRGLHTKLLIPEPTTAVLTLHERLRRAASAVLIQMQTGRIGLGVYLGQFVEGVSTRCSCNLGVQSVRHVLFDCPQHAMLRARTLWATSRETSLFRTLNTPELARQAVEFMLQTRVLAQFTGLAEDFRAYRAD
jgi:hypothetical protein